MSGASQGALVARKTGDVDLIDGDGLRGIVEGMLAKTTQQRRQLARVVQLVGQRYCSQRLAAMRKIQQARCTIDRRAEIIAAAFFRVSVVERHANAKSADRRPVCGSQGLLRRDRRAHGVRGRFEGGEERIAAGLEYDAVMLRNGVTQYFVVLGHGDLHRRAVVQPAQTGPFNVRQQECVAVYRVFRCRYRYRAVIWKPHSTCCSPPMREVVFIPYVRTKSSNVQCYVTAWASADVRGLGKRTTTMHRTGARHTKGTCGDYACSSHAV